MIHGLAFSPDSARIACAYWTRAMAIFSLPDGNRLIECDTQGTLPVFPNFSDDGTRLLSLDEREPNLNLRDAANGSLIRRQRIPEHPVAFVRIPGAGRVAIGCTDGSVRVFPTDVSGDSLWSPTLVIREAPTPTGITYLAVAPDGRTLCGWQGDGHWII